MTTISTAISNTTPNGGAPSRIQDVNNGRSQVGQPVGGGTGTGGNTGGTGGTGGNTGGNGGGTVDNGEVAGNDGAPSNASGQTTTISTAEYNRLVRAAAASTSGLGAFSPVGGAGLGAAMGLFSALPRMLGGGGLFGGGGGRGGCSGGGGGSGASGIAGAHDRAGNFGNQNNPNSPIVQSMNSFLESSSKPQNSLGKNFAQLDEVQGGRQLNADIQSFLNTAQQRGQGDVSQFSQLNARLANYTDQDGERMNLNKLAQDSEVTDINYNPPPSPPPEPTQSSVEIN